MPKRNLDIRKKVLLSGVRFYDVAEVMHISPSNLSMRLNRDLLPREKEQILAAIDTAKAELLKEMVTEVS